MPPLYGETESHLYPVRSKSPQATAVSTKRTSNRVYSTWEIVEFDTCISAWLIKRFIDKEADFKFFTKGELITEGTPFDTPDAELRRRNNMSTYEIVLKKYKIKDPILIQIGRIVHEIEVGYWGKRQEISKEIDKKVREIIDNSKDKSECFKKSFAVFDDLYERLKKSKNSI